MKGIGRSSGAISFVNALFSGVGAAGAIDLRVEARIELETAVSAPAPVEVPPGDSELVRATLARALTEYGAAGTVVKRFDLRSAVPPAAGLKSSSAVSSAVLQSVAHACGRRPPFTELAALSARVSREVGLSATGAFDDALACLSGGCVVTDNRALRVLRAGASSLEGRVLLWTPPDGTHRPSPEYEARFQSREAEIGPAVAAALAGRFLEAMETNGRLVEEVLGYDYDSLRKSAHELGAAACGVTGMGPTLAVVSPPAAAGNLRRLLRGRGGTVRSTRFLPPRRLPPPGKE